MQSVGWWYVPFAITVFVLAMSAMHSITRATRPRARKNGGRR